jgi:hypothetical protein
MTNILNQYITATAGSWITNLPLSGADVELIETNTLLAYGVASVSEIDTTVNVNLLKLYALADVEIWTKVLNEISQDYDFSADGTSHSRSQAFTQVTDLLNTALIKASAYINAPIITTISYDVNPYGYPYPTNLDEFQPFYYKRW